MEKLVNEWMDGWMEELVNGWVDRRAQMSVDVDAFWKDV